MDLTQFSRLAFVDLETTGMAATADRITEIGIVSVDEHGVGEWSSLVNPQGRIPEFIESLTGISNAMVENAPTFAEIACEVQQRLQDRVFIAHNARFDHGFLKNEFKRLGIEFKPKVLCTVKLSRRLYPGFSRHNLDALIERHRLLVTTRHRALGDARLIWQFWQVVQREFPSEQIQTVFKELTARPTLPSHLDPGLIDTLPTSHGVYLFHGENALLYVGKANDIRKRVLSHFSTDHQSSKELDLSQQVRRIEWIETAGEIGALLKEAMLVKQLSPTHNHRLRRNDEICTWRLVRRSALCELKLAMTDDLFFDQDQNLYGMFTSMRKAIASLTAIAEANQLCPAILGLEKVKAGKPCFASQVKLCRGTCTGKEDRAEHDQRLATALEPMRLQNWPYPGPIGLKEKQAIHVIHGWSYLGTAKSEDEVWSMATTSRPRFDRDVYQILHKRMPDLQHRIVRLG